MVTERNIAKGFTQSPRVSFSQRPKTTKPGSYVTDEYGRRLMRMPDGSMRAETSLEKAARFKAIADRNVIPCDCGHELSSHAWKDTTKKSTVCNTDGCPCPMFKRYEEKKSDIAG